MRQCARDDSERDELRLLDDELLLELEDDLLEDDDELEDELRLLELDEDELEEDELDEAKLDELELDDDAGDDELEEDNDGPVGELVVPQALSMPTPASARLPERILRNSRRSSRCVVSSLTDVRGFSAMARHLLSCV